MKTVKIALVLLLTTFFYNNADAQILRNSFLIGGSMNFDYSNGKTTVERTGSQSFSRNEPTTTVFGIEPRFGYFLADNFCLGLNLDFRMNSTTADYTPRVGPTFSQTTTTTRLITGPFARYYGALSDNVYAFGEVSFGGGLDSRLVSDPDDSLQLRGPQSVSVSNLQFGVGPGLNFFLNDYVAFEALAKYTYSQSTFSAFNEKAKTVGSNIRFTVGLQVYFRAITAGIKE
ncbi:MAG: outer membrane beta-barrel protein [Bacteroidia bacterium]